MAIKLQSADRPAIPPGLSRIAVLFTPDPPPLALRALAALEKSIPVTVCVHALPSEAGAFVESNEPATPAIVVVGRAADWRSLLDWYKGPLRENPVG